MEDKMKTAEEKIREAKKLTEGLLPTRNGEGCGMTAPGEHMTLVGQNAAIDEYAAKVVNKHRESE
jgi:hypothetical protein